MGSSVPERGISPPGAPAGYAGPLLDCLERGAFLSVVIDAGGKVVWANRSFRQAVLEGGEPAGLAFGDLLDGASVNALPHLRPFLPGEVKSVELRHRTSVGAITISYQLREGPEGSLCAVGSDRTEEKELIEQMTALIEDLHREFARRSELAKRLEEQAITDALTSLSNRRRFDEAIQTEWGRARRYGDHFALLLIDLDRFKQVNDRLGHLLGDEVLVRVARVLRSEVRSEDIVARYGGDEMAVIALAADARKARELGDRLRQKVAAAPMPPGVPPVTISIGVAATSGGSGPSSLEELIARADAALYRAKEGGRNRVETDLPAGLPADSPAAGPRKSGD